MERRRDRLWYGVIGTTASIAASLMIAVVLCSINYQGVVAAFKAPMIYVLAFLILIGVIALYGYLGFAVESYNLMKNLSPIALVLGAVSAALGIFDPLLGGALIVIAYVIEFAVGSKLYKDYEKYNPLGARLFLAGVTIFVASLPFILHWRPAALVAMAGDYVKLTGLLLVLYSIDKESRRA